MALPPEVYSTLLDSGPGPGSLLVSAGACQKLSVEYASVAAELRGVLATVKGGAWQGQSSERYATAHGPYLAWLMKASANSGRVAAQYEAVAAAYVAASAAMPTLVELATNHATHGALVATNFFGLNAVPIAFNEADYLRMWVQAATTMALYQLLVGEALGLAPRATAAPVVAGLTGSPFGAVEVIVAPLWVFGRLLRQLWHRFLRSIKNTWHALLFFGSLLLMFSYQVFWNIVGWPTWAAILSAPFLLPIVLGLSLGAAMLLPALAVIPGLAGTPPVAGTPGLGWPAAGSPPPPATSTAAVSTSVSGANAGPAAAPPPTPGAEGFAYVVGGGGWAPYAGPTLGGRDGAGAPAAAISAASAVEARRAQQRTRRRRRVEVCDHGDEFLDIESAINGPSEELMTSAQGTGVLGFAGTAAKEITLPATGLATLATGEFGGDQRAPMLPGTWRGPQAPGRGEGARNINGTIHGLMTSNRNSI